jgi:hypothetical protein
MKVKMRYEINKRVKVAIFMCKGEIHMLKAIKKLTVSLVTVAVLSTTVATSISAARELRFQPVTQMPKVIGGIFSDVDRNERYILAVDFLYKEGILQGKSATQFGVYDQIKRGDAAVILAKALSLDTENAPDAGFTDVNPRIEQYVNALAEAEIISGVTKDQFMPDEPLTRGASAKILALGFDFADYAEETPFTDATGVFKPYIEALYGTTITAGKTPTFYGNNQEITRGDFASLLYKSILFSEKGSLIFAHSAEMVDTSTLSVSYKDVIPEKYTAQDIAEATILFAKLENSETGRLNPEEVDLHPENAVFSDDRKTIKFNHKDLAGYSGLLTIDDLLIVFEY